MRRATGRDSELPARRRPFYRRLAAWAAVLALVIQSLLPLAHARHHAAAGDLSLATLGQEAGYGKGTNAPADTRHGPAADHDCALCKGIQLLGAGLAPQSALAVALVVFDAPFAPVWSYTVIASRFHRATQPRAPPSLT